MFPCSCSLAGLILISTVVCFLLPPFRYHLTLTHTYLYLYYLLRLYPKLFAGWRSFSYPPLFVFFFIARVLSCVYPLTLVHGDTAVESADCANPGVVACFKYFYQTVWFPIMLLTLLLHLHCCCCATHWWWLERNVKIGNEYAIR